MKNYIYYYYNLTANEIHQNGKTYFFMVGDILYELMTTKIDKERSIEVYELSTVLINCGLKIHQIIFNRDNEILTTINEEKFVLMKVAINKNRRIKKEDINAFANFTYGYSKKLNWKELWPQKIDYLEYQNSELGKKFKMINESFNYFIGLAENSIHLINLVPIEQEMVVSHRRIKSNHTLYDLYNPFNMIVDSKIRDICEYYKYRFFYDNIDDEEIISFILYSGYNDDEKQLFFARFMYPTYYFDLFEELITSSENDFALKKIINKVEDYQSLLCKLYNAIKKNMRFPIVEWLENHVSQL